MFPKKLMHRTGTKISIYFEVLFPGVFIDLPLNVVYIFIFFSGKEFFFLFTFPVPSKLPIPTHSTTLENIRKSVSETTQAETQVG